MEETRHDKDAGYTTHVLPLNGRETYQANHVALTKAYELSFTTVSGLCCS